MNATADALCSRARSKELLYDDLRKEADGLLLDLARCEGGVDQLQKQESINQSLMRQLAQTEVERDSRFARIWVVVALVTGFTLGGIAGWALNEF